MVASKQLSLESLWAIMGRAWKLSTDFDAEKEKTKIEADAEAMASRMPRDFKRGGADDDGSA